MKYFEDLYKKLCNEDGQEGPFISVDGEIIGTDNQLKDYMCTILKSNMQYDFGIDFTDDDVIKFAVALVSDYVKDKSETDIIQLFDNQTSKKISSAYDCELAFNQLTGNVDADTKQRIYCIAEYIWLKDETSMSINTILDAVVELINDGEKIEDLEKMGKWHLIEMVHALKD